MGLGPQVRWELGVGVTVHRGTGFSAGLCGRCRVNAVRDAVEQTGVNSQSQSGEIETDRSCCSGTDRDGEMESEGTQP